MQEWECRRKADGELRMYKCRGQGIYQLPADDSGRRNDRSRPATKTCDCGLPAPQGLSRNELRRQRQFLNHHVSQGQSDRDEYARLLSKILD